MADNNLRINLIGNAAPLTRSLNTASGRLKSFGKSVSSVGKSLQTRLALPLIAAGGTAIKMAMDFDKSMTQIQSLVGVAADEVDKMGDAAKKMALDTGKSSAEAANALFFITSAGLRGAEATDVLNASLKASAVGLGDTATVADLATSAMNAYGSANLNAEAATDVMVAAVREGKLEATELAGSMGRVLPVASNMGISFNEVGAAFAAMSRTGTNAAEASTQLRGILVGILNPTKTAEKALQGMGLSSAGLRKSLKEDGLLATLEILKENFEGNDTAAQKVFGNVRALTGVMDLLGAGVDTTRSIFAAMNETQGATQAAFDKTSQSASFRLKKGLNSVRESFTDLGAILLDTFLPVIQKVTKFVSGLFEKFQGLDGGTQTLILSVGALLTVLPTLITLFGTLSSVVGFLLSPVGLVAAALAGVAYVIYKNWNEVLPVVVGLYNQFVDLYNGSEALRKVIFFLKAAFKTVFVFARTQIKQLLNGFSTLWKLIKEFSEKGMKGSFGNILKEGFEESVKITKDAATEIGETFSDELGNAVGSTLQKKTVEQVQTGLNNAASDLEGFVKGIAAKIGIGAGGGAPKEGEGDDTLKPSHDLSGYTLTTVIPDETVNKTRTAADKIREFLDKVGVKGEFVGQIMDSMSQGIEDAFVGMGQNIAASMAEADSAFGAFLSTFLSGAMTYISALMAQSMHLGVTAAGQTALAAGPMAAFVLPALIAGTVALISSSFNKAPKFADGGIVSGPTLGLMGEYTGAKSNPEVIAPLDKLQSMIEGRGGAQQVQVGGEFRLQGQDLVVALQRAERVRGRLK